MGGTTTDVLAGLLDEDLSSDPTTSNHLTNHLPMALVAKQRLGASDAELRRFAHHYVRRVVPLAPARDELTDATWRRAMGQRGSSGDLRRYFVRRVHDDGVEATLRAHAPDLLAGVSGAAFHGVIRLAYALEVSSPARVAAALAYWAEVATPLGEIREVSPTTDDPRDLLAELAASGEWSTPMQGHNITEEMRAAAAHPRFATVPASLHLDAHTAERLAATALRVYASSDDFTALHGVTGLAALDALRPYLDNQLGLDRYAFQALAAAYLSFGAPALWSEDRLGAFASSNPVPPTATEFAGANSDDEHVAKLVYSAHRAWRSSGDPLYLAVAARKAGLFDTRRPDRRPVARRAVS